MHPKGPFDVQVTVENIETTDKGTAWFNKTHVGVLDQCRAFVRQNVAGRKTTL